MLGSPGARIKLECLVGDLHQSRGSEVGDTLPYEDFQVLKRIAGRAGHRLNDVMVPFRKTRVSTVAMDRSDVDVRLYEVRARVVLPLASLEVRDPK